MSATVQRTLNQLVVEVQREVYRDTDWPHATQLDGALDASSPTFNVDNVTQIAASKRVEIDYEQMLVTDVTDPQLTVVRAYAGTDPVGHDDNTQVLLDPTYSKARIRQSLLRAFSHLHSNVPNVVSEVYQIETDLQQVFLPANTVTVWGVYIELENSGKVVEIGDWKHLQEMPTSVADNGQLLVPPSATGNDDELIVMRQIPWYFTDVSAGGGALTNDPDPEDTIDLPVGSADLPVLYSLAYLQMNREVARADLDSVAEWTEEQARVAGVNLRALVESWRLFYRRADEAKSVIRMPIRRPFRKMAKGF